MSKNQLVIFIVASELKMGFLYINLYTLYIHM
jgi:hypothetical protein